MDWEPKMSQYRILRFKRKKGFVNFEIKMKRKGISYCPFASEASAVPSSGITVKSMISVW